MKHFFLLIIFVFTCNVAWGDNDNCKCGCDKIWNNGGFCACTPGMDTYDENQQLIKEPPRENCMFATSEWSINQLKFIKLQKEIQSLKDRIAELEVINIPKVRFGTATASIVEEKDDDRYYFHGGLGHTCGGYIENGQINLYAVMCRQCDKNVINDIKRRHSSP